MANTDNLKNWEKGQSGNPKGRPKGSLNRNTIAKRWLKTIQKYKNPISHDDEDLSQEDIMTLALINKARKGDARAYSELMNSAYGKAKESVDITQFIEQPLFLDVSENDSNTEDSEAQSED
jgi:hypothetical protein|tara:strand:+ start:146 stop:508 length:363 start_codon:yes stop_codon:yes gene_type:complete